MAVVFMTGWEMGSVDIQASGTDPIETTIVPGSWSTYSRKHGNSNSTYLLPSPISEFYFGFRIHPGNLSDQSIVKFQSPSAGNQCALRLSSAGHIQVVRGNAPGVVLATGTATLATGNWYYVECHMIVSDTVGAYETRINGTVDLAYTTGQDTRTDGTYSTVDRINLSGNGIMTMYFDDMYLCDTTGSANSGYLGNPDLKIQGFSPSAAGDHTGLTPSTGANYTCVDEVPPSDSDYVTGTDTSAYDLYNIPNLTGITGIQAATLWLRAAAASAANVATVVKYDSDADGTADTESVGSDQALSASFGYFHTVYDTDPAGATWTTAKANALQIGAKSR